MMKSDFEILEQWIKEYNIKIPELSYPEEILYKCELRNSMAFTMYLTRYRILEFCDEFVKTLSKLRKKL